MTGILSKDEFILLTTPNNYVKKKSKEIRVGADFSIDWSQYLKTTTTHFLFLYKSSLI